ncbi:phage portal protein [Methylobacillus flagellatus]|uniref:phage portal protein n=1 Tax=Methylobacillus flagellatus TaxID=405 RepID=UPI002853B204|nr:phage portal protein [Methylobacillus flagellatus]MDR5170721.1 phage portal protein [Methylobacillus flagellatus]
MTTWADVQEKIRHPGSRVLAEWRERRVIEAAERAAVGKTNALLRQYAGAEFNRLTSDWTATSTSADSEIIGSLRALRDRSRQLIRDNETAKNAQRIVWQNVIGPGIGLQAQVKGADGKLIKAINDDIEGEWCEWAMPETCHVAGLLGFADIEAWAWSQIFEAGEAIIRIVRQPFGGSRIPLGLELIEADRLMDQWQTARAPNGNLIRMGVEMDNWGRAVAYWFHPGHPGDYAFRSFEPAKFIRIPASDIIHLYQVERWPQTRGVPMLHATIRRLRDMAGYSEAEIVAARASANIVGFIKSEAGDEPEYRKREIDSAPGTFKQLLPGEDFVGFNPSRPNAALEPFMRFMLRSVAAGVGISYESLSKDFSQSNYSSSRLSLLEDRVMYRILQGWTIRKLRLRLHLEFMDAAVLSGVLSIDDYYTRRRVYTKARFKPRGWSWIDPQKEVNAYKMAVRGGFTTRAEVIAETGSGLDFEDVAQGLSDENALLLDLGLVVDTDPSQVNDKGAEQPQAGQTGDKKESE